jgi:hypothetical protein
MLTGLGLGKMNTTWRLSVKVGDLIKPLHHFAGIDQYVNIVGLIFMYGEEQMILWNDGDIEALDNYVSNDVDFGEHDLEVVSEGR